jgi:hypothetical protein
MSNMFLRLNIPRYRVVNQGKPAPIIINSEHIISMRSVKSSMSDGTYCDATEINTSSGWTINVRESIDEIIGMFK